MITIIYVLSRNMKNIRVFYLKFFSCCLVDVEIFNIFE